MKLTGQLFLTLKVHNIYKGTIPVLPKMQQIPLSRFYCFNFYPHYSYPVWERGIL